MLKSNKLLILGSCGCSHTNFLDPFKFCITPEGFLSTNTHSLCTNTHSLCNQFMFLICNGMYITIRLFSIKI